MAKPIGASVVVEGLAEALAALDKVASAELRDAALWDGATVVVERAQDLAPRITGALQASIYAVTKRRSGYFMAAAAAQGLGDDSFELVPEVTVTYYEARIASCAIYANSIEWNHQAFLRPALDGSHGEIVLAMELATKRGHKDLA